MRKIALSTLALATLAAPAFASDLPSRKAPAAYIAPIAAYSWTGAYIGVEAGANFLRQSDTYASYGNYPGLTYGLNQTKALLGGLVGYNYQFASNVVIGLEGNVDGLLGGNKNLTVSSTSPVVVRGTGSTYDAAIRGRLGYAFDRTLAYVAGGVAFGNLKTKYTYASATTPYFSDSESRTGWTVGGGLEHAFTNDLLGRIEYRYTDLGSKNVTSSTLGTTDKLRLTSNSVLVGLSYKFGAPETAVVAKY